MLEHKAIWENCLSFIRDNVSGEIFETWFRPIVPLKLEGKILTLQVKSHFCYEYLEEQYIDLLRTTLRREIGEGAKLEYSVLMQSAPRGNNYRVSYPTQSKPAIRRNPVNVEIKPKVTKNDEIKNPFVVPGVVKRINIESQLNQKFSFDNFIEGECNKLGRAVGLSISQRPGSTAFNPLFIYGESGLGKTHLAQAIGIAIKSNPSTSDKTVLYVSAHRFQSQFTEAAVVRKNINDFINFYQLIDVLIIDDVHVFAGKQKTQEAFFQIFNHLHQTGKQIILTCDRPPSELTDLNDRLLSRFKWGLSAELKRPNIETKKNIIRNKLYNEGIELDNDVIEYLAENIKSNIRELEGSLISLLAQATFNKKEINIKLAQSIIGKIVQKTEPTTISIDKIENIVCTHLNIKKSEIHSKSRKRPVVQARQIAMYFSKKMTDLSLSAIGRSLGNKDHTTVLHACKTIESLLDTDVMTQTKIKEISAKLA